MSIDDSFLRNPRVVVLGKLCGWSRRETMGALLDVWAICYDQISATLSVLIIDTAAELDGFASHLVEAELGKRMSGGRVRIAGVEERVSYLNAKAEAGRQGGVKSGETRRKRGEAKPEANTKQAGSTPQAPPNPSASASASVPDSAPVPDLVLVPDPAPDIRAAAPVTRKVKPKTESRSPEFQPAIDAFHQYYKRTNGGHKPTWGTGRANMMKELVGKHTCAEVIRRIGILESHPPKFPPTPWDLPTFVSNIDKVATAPAPKPMDGLAYAQAVGRGEIP